MGTVCQALPARRRARACSAMLEWSMGGGEVTIVMGIDQHRAQISSEWIDMFTAEVSRARVASADRAGVQNVP